MIDFHYCGMQLSIEHDNRITQINYHYKFNVHVHVHTFYVCTCTCIHGLHNNIIIPMSIL